MCTVTTTMPYLSQFGAHFNKKLMLSLSVVVVSTFNFSFDKQDFSPARATDLTIKQFGIETKHGKYRLQVYWLSLHSSLIFADVAAAKPMHVEI